MKSIDQWLTEYARDHKNPTNKLIHKFCVPAIMLSLFGLLWSIPKPSFFPDFVFLNWATIFCFLCLIFYISLDIIYALMMLALSLVMLFIIYKVSQTEFLLSFSVSVFVIAWIGQFIGHKIEGQKPSFLEDLQFLLIGPLWVFKDLRSLLPKP